MKGRFLIVVVLIFVSVAVMAKPARDDEEDAGLASKNIIILSVKNVISLFFYSMTIYYLSSHF